MAADLVQDDSFTAQWRLKRSGSLMANGQAYELFVRTCETRSPRGPTRRMAGRGHSQWRGARASSVPSAANPGSRGQAPHRHFAQHFLLLVRTPHDLFASRDELLLVVD